MGDIEKALGLAVRDLSDKNYEQSLTFCCFWIDIGRTYREIPLDQIVQIISNNRVGVSFRSYGGSQLIHPTAHLIPRLANDVESDHNLAPYSSGLQSHLSRGFLQGFFDKNLEIVDYKLRGYDNRADGFYADANLIAHSANLGYVEEATIRNHILQSLISHPKLYDHQAEALMIMFKLAGATFAAYVDPSVVHRCFDLFKDHFTGRDLMRMKLVEVRVP